MERERDASPERFPSQQPGMQEEYEAPLHTGRSSISGSSAHLQEIGGLERIETQHERDYDVERHPTALSRIHTGRSQHSQTVATYRTRSSRASGPLPAFGGGKPFPPALPEREEYVVEFDGPNDPLHAQNWPMKKK